MSASRRGAGVGAAHLVTLLSVTLLLAVGLSPVLAQDDSPLDEWTWRNPLPQGNTVSCAVHAQGRYLAIGWNVLMTSPDGRSWTHGEPGWAPADYCHALLYEDGLYLISLRGEEERVLLSEDGETWTSAWTWSSGISQTFGFAHGAETYVAVGQGVAFSADGRSWSRAEVLPSNVEGSLLYGATHGDHGFVAVGNQGVVITSPDANTWSQVESRTNEGLNDVAHGNGAYVAVGRGGVILRSTDAEEWRRISSQTDVDLSRVVYSGNRFMVATADGSILTSEDGRRWQRASTGLDVGLLDFAHDGDRHLAVGEHGALVLSENGRRWQPVSRSLTFRPLNGLASEGKRVVAVGGDAAILTSDDAGRTWRARQSPSRGALRDVIRGGGQFVAVGESGTVLTSPNGIGWAPRRAGQSQHLNAVTYGENQYVAVGTKGRVFTSPDGRRWTARESGTDLNLHGVTSGNGLFVAVGGGDPGVVVTSLDGVHWNAAEIPEWIEGVVFDVAYGNGRFVAVGEAAQGETSVAVSDDGLNWRVNNLERGGLRGVTFSHGTFLAVGVGYFDRSLMYSSPDGEDWQRHRVPTIAPLNAALLVQRSFLIAGVGGAILQSEPYVAARPAFSPRGDTYRNPQTVTLASGTDAATVRYTTDGSRPTCGRGTEISSGGFVTIDRDTTLRAVACAEGYGVSDVRKEAYRIRPRR